MRTDTATFRANAFKALRAQGVNSVKSREIAGLLVWQLRYRHVSTLPDSARIKVSFDAEHAQTVAVVDGPSVILHLDGHTLRLLQPLVKCVPTPRQLEIGELLSAMMSDVYDAIGDACQAYEARFGHPADAEACLVRDAFVKAFPAVAEVNGRYDALKAESLAINPNVSATLVDPDKASHWYEWHHDLYNYRPSGFRTLAAIEAEMAHMATIPMGTFDEQDAA